jgi:hypothetical protein
MRVVHGKLENASLSQGSRSVSRIVMDTLVRMLDSKLRQWSPEVAEQVRARIAEIIELADQDLLDVARSRAIEQEVLDVLDEPSSR